MGAMSRAALVVVVVASCYRANAPAGAPCSADGECPTPLVCVASTCTANGVDAGQVTYDDAAPPADAPSDLTCECSGSATLACSDGSTTPCDISCADAGSAGPAHCTTLTPSNNVSTDLLTGTAALAISNFTVFNTDTGAVTGGLVRAAGSGVIAGVAYGQAMSGGHSLGVFAFEALTVASGATIHFNGVRAAVFLVGGQAIVAGTVDLSGGCYGKQISCAGPGGGAGAIDTATPGGCGPGAPGISDDSTGADTGGGGGAFGGTGGTGGTETASGVGFDGGGGGAACAPFDLVPLIGGGGGGGGGPGSGTPTSGGGGGGGLQISALGSITISGTINAGGGGGDTGPTNVDNGGAPGGGGAGGAILLESPSVTLASGGVLAANGGGGGGATDHLIAGGTGQPGQASTAPATGGAAANGGTGNGGNGGSRQAAPGNGGDSTDVNSGAGGGSVGRIFIRSVGGATLSGAVSPPAVNSNVHSQ
ncbi:MAG TPA: hypothetical protein VH143_04330 [Kofleriaceae bacterium]|jgi:hypothetical protein|nr:hypothetical protein [Kofleriaceae bacterium]